MSLKYRRKIQIQKTDKIIQGQFVTEQILDYFCSSIEAITYWLASHVSKFQKSVKQDGISFDTK